jgi:hypothetical protein
MRAVRNESFAKPCPTGHVVIPAKAGIQCYQVLSGFRVKPGMIGGGIIQTRSRNEEIPHHLIDKKDHH